MFHIASMVLGAIILVCAFTAIFLDRGGKPDPRIVILGLGIIISFILLLSSSSLAYKSRSIQRDALEIMSIFLLILGIISIILAAANKGNNMRWYRSWIAVGAMSQILIVVITTIVVLLIPSSEKKNIDDVNQNTWDKVDELFRGDHHNVIFNEQPLEVL